MLNIADMLMRVLIAYLQIRYIKSANICSSATKKGEEEKPDEEGLE